MTPHSRRMFERNMSRLNELFRRDQIIINQENVRSIRAIKAARHTPNNRANLSTIDQFGAQMANHVTEMAEHSIERSSAESTD